MKLNHLVVLLTISSAAAIGAAIASEHEERASEVAPVADALYARECGACHFAYPPGLLPARSWDKLMGGLATHFGESAELAPEDARAIRAYLTSHAADNTASGISARIMRSIGAGEPPLRISEVPYIAREHREVPARLVAGNPQVKSLSRCNACHTNAQAGGFSEHQVTIPGVGRWED